MSGHSQGAIATDGEKSNCPDCPEKNRGWAAFWAAKRPARKPLTPLYIYFLLKYIYIDAQLPTFLTRTHPSHARTRTHARARLHVREWVGLCARISGILGICRLMLCYCYETCCPKLIFQPVQTWAPWAYRLQTDATHAKKERRGGRHSLNPPHIRNHGGSRDMCYSIQRLVAQRNVSAT